MNQRLLVLASWMVIALTKGYAQDVLTAKRSSFATTAFKQPQQSLKEVLLELEKRYDVHFLYEGKIIEDRLVHYGTKRKDKLEAILRQILSADLSFKRINANLYSIFPATDSSVPAPAKLRQEQTNRQMEDKTHADRSVSGTVTDAETNQGLPGVSIVVKGTTTGTTSDQQGQYRLNVPDGAVLVFSFVGYLPQETAIAEQATLNVALRVNSKSLSEVVVVGYGTQKKRDITGAIGSVNENTIKALPVSRFEQALQGRISGVNVVTSGAPGGAVSVRIRGIGSINNNQPLFVIDGIPVFGDGALNTINPSDIASMEVLKDASATAIYGARAANGVVIVTTKRGQEGKVNLSYDGYGGVQQIAHRYTMLNAEQYALLSNEMRSAQHTDNLTPEWSIPEAIPGGVDTDWQKALFQEAAIQNHSLTLSGGVKDAHYLVSGNYFNQDGTVIGSNFKRYSLRVNTDAKLFNRVKVGTSLLFSRTQELRNGGADQIESALRQLPTIPVYFPDGSWGGPQGVKDLYNDVRNPVAQALTNQNTAGRYRLLGNLFAEIDLLPGLTFRSSYSTDLSILETKNFSPSYQYGVLFSATASLSQTNARANTQVFDNILTYKRTIGNHALTLMGVYSAQETAYASESASTVGLISNSLPYLAAYDPAGVRNIGSAANEFALLSYTGRLNYEYADKYLFSATFRRDGSSRFGKNNPYANFPAFSVGWRISDENFMKGFTFLNELKIRGSWGQSGNQEIGNYAFSASLSDARRYVLGTAQSIIAGIVPSSLANPDIRWETATQTNIGLDASLWSNRLSFSANYYIKNTTDMLVQVPIPASSGITSYPYINAGSIKNQGLEFELNYRNQIGGLKYEIGGNLSTLNNKVTSLGSGQPIFSGTFITAGNGTGGQNTTVTRVGDPVGSFYGYVMEGIFQNQAEIDAHAVQSGNTRPGDVKFLDLNGDNKIDASDRAIIGKPLPDGFYGLNGNLSFKNFDLGLFFQGVYGNQIFNGTRVRVASMFAIENQTAEVLSRWRGEGTSNTVPRAVALDPIQNGRNSTRWIEDGSYLRLKNLTLGYNLPASLSNRIKAQKIRLYLSATNLLTFTHYKGLDPEVGDRDQNALFSGIDQNIYPVSRTYTVGLSASF